MTAQPLPAPVFAQTFDAGVFGEPVALIIALVVAFVVIVGLLLLLFYPKGDPAASRTLRRGLTMIDRGNAPVRQEAGLTASAIGRTAIDLVARAPKPKGYDERLQARIDQAGWQLRASEFTAIRVVGALLALTVLWALTGSWIMGLIGVVAGVVGPVLLLSSAATRRQNRFMQQLPDTLQLLAGTLKAGYGVLQAIDTVVKEVDDPMSSEFQRVLTEARLGLPLEESLEAMADRIGNDDFRWVVVAMNIQRQVGGNLAELLETVSETLRGREQVRRQVDVLTAEGRLSAIILFALPIALFVYLLVVNPEYILTLFTHPIGLVLLLGGVVLMGLGWIWIRRMIKIEV